MSDNPFMQQDSISAQQGGQMVGENLIAAAGIEPGDLVTLTWESKTDGHRNQIVYTGTFNYWGESVLWIEITGPKAPGHYRMPVAALHRVILERKGKQLPKDVQADNPFVDLQEIAFKARDETKSRYNVALDSARKMIAGCDLKAGDYVVAKIRKGQVDDDRNVEVVTGLLKDLTNATIIIDGVNGEPKVYRQTHLALLAAIEKQAEIENPFMYVNSAPANPFMV